MSVVKVRRVVVAMARGWPPGRFVFICWPNVGNRSLKHLVAEEMAMLREHGNTASRNAPGRVETQGAKNMEPQRHLISDNTAHELWAIR